MKTKVSKLLVFVPALCIPALASAQQEQYWPGPWHMWGGGWGFWWIFPLLMCFVVIAVCFGIFSMMHRAGGHSSHYWRDPAYSALQLLNERFAKGEIQKQEYEDKKVAILSDGPR